MADGGRRRANSGAGAGGAYDDIRSSLTRLHGHTDDMEKFRRDKGAGGPGSAKTLKTKNANMQELLSKQIEHAYNELAQKEEDLKLAAEIGQHLLEKVETSMERAAGLETSLAEAEQGLSRFRDEKEAWVRRERKLNVDIGDLEDHKRYLEMELGRASEALNELRDERGAASEQGAELGDALRKLAALEKEHAEVGAQLRTLTAHHRAEKAAHREDAAELAAAREKLERLAGAERRAEALEKRMADYTELKRAKADLEWEYGHANAALRETSLAHEQLRRDYAKMQEMLDEARAELRRAGVSFSFDSSLASQMMGDDAAPATPDRPAGGRAGGLHMRSPSLADELNMDGGSSDSSDDDDDDDAAAGGSGGDGGGRGADAAAGSSASTGSILSSGSLPAMAPVCENSVPDESELAAATAAGGPATPAAAVAAAAAAPVRAVPANAPSSNSGALALPEGDEPETDEDLKMREFFQLTVLAIKINSGDILEHIQSISGRALYRKCKEQNTPFHMFYNWIKREITAAYIASRYEVQSTSSNERSAAPAAAAGGRRRRATAIGRARAGSASANARIDEGRNVAKAMGGTNYEARTVPRRVSRTGRQ